MLHTILVIWCCQKKNNKGNIILRMKVICQVLVLMNFALQELKIFFSWWSYSWGGERKERCSNESLIYLNCNYTVLSLLFAVLYQAFKPRLLVALVSFNSPLATGDCQFLALNLLSFFFSLIVFFCSRHICPQWSVMQHFSYSEVKWGTWKMSVI